MVSFLRDCLEIIGNQPKDPGEKNSDILACIYLIRGYGRIYSRRKRMGAENVLSADLFCWEPHKQYRLLIITQFSSIWPQPLVMYCERKFAVDGFRVSSLKLELTDNSSETLKISNTKINP